MGRGVINGNGTYWRPRGGWYSLILLKNAKNVLLQDTLLQDPAVANVWMSYSENLEGAGGDDIDFFGGLGNAGFLDSVFEFFDCPDCGFALADFIVDFVDRSHNII
jgi:hypothetical protein